MTDPSSSYLLSQDELRTEVRQGSREVFLSRYSDHVLWVLPLGVDPSVAGAVPSLDSLEYKRTILQADRETADPAALAALARLVIPLRKRPGNPFPDMFSVGRAVSSDVVIPLGSISKLHAYFQRNGQAWTATDCSSTNGTWVRDEQLPPRSAVPLQDGDPVRFGKDLYCRFLSAGALYDQLKKSG